MPDVQLVGVQDPSAEVAAQRAAVLGGPPVFTDYATMLERDPAGLRHRPRAAQRHGGHAHYLLDEGYPFLMEKPMGMNADEVRRIAEKAAAKRRLRRRAVSPSAISRSPPRAAAPRRGPIRAAVPHLRSA